MTPIFDFLRKEEQHEYGEANCHQNDNKDVLPKEIVLSTIISLDNLRSQLMTEAIIGGNKVALMSALMLHQVACPAFYALEYYEYGRITDYWKEDAAIDVFENFKKNPLEGLKKDLTLYENELFPLRTIDKNGALLRNMITIIKVLLKELER